MRVPSVFYAIPCGEFYSTQAKAIKDVSQRAEIEAVIAEDDPTTKGLWDKITEQIDKCDLLVADISSGSANIAVELGYAVARKPEGSVGIFISDNVQVPADLQRFVLQKYSSLSSFRQRLITWLSEALPLIDPRRFEGLSDTKAEFTEDFKSQDNFLRRWWTPPGCQYFLTHEGLRFSWAHFPILTTVLSLLHNCEFEFLARIEATCIGWAIRGTRHPTHSIPSSCIMFNLSGDGLLVPHIWSARNVDPRNAYHVFSEQAVHAEVNWSPEGWFRLLTRVRGTVIEIENQGRLLFSADFSAAPYSDAYADADLREGQVGFRCHPGEVATVAEVRVREL